MSEAAISVPQAEPFPPSETTGVCGKLRAFVIGGTGAVGRFLVAELLNSPCYERVVLIGRSPYQIPPNTGEDADIFPFGPYHSKVEVEKNRGRLVEIKVEKDILETLQGLNAVDIPAALDAPPAPTIYEEDENAVAVSRPAFPDAPYTYHFFSCLGTTRGDAGSAEAFRHIDLSANNAFADLSKRLITPAVGNLGYMGLLSSVGASSSSWFLYPKTKGEAEDYFRAAGFSRLSIFRPGAIQRGSHLRWTERILVSVVPSVSAAAIARAMIRDALAHSNIITQFRSRPNPAATIVTSASGPITGKIQCFLNGEEISSSLASAYRLNTAPGAVFAQCVPPGSRLANIIYDSAIKRMGLF
ncbi:hypothetical protein H696_02983 [Fonticula alba]|uniref:Semialdehyde dehydrogenase NAD-binding domain-containing protein n=1 Tax=Fonticula alba TaxID=691883 RepID=A0A058Z953_FONAL|nr:hypothetical protein H696_02983 [Fonticula alba]KCV70626.1 hypothetical protein H696_02983 [Fonticula alba]|eukprot:XP_009495142.1 hypothetical protein H696_02983 [Fonticula alba]